MRNTPCVVKKIAVFRSSLKSRLRESMLIHCMYMYIFPWLRIDQNSRISAFNFPDGEPASAQHAWLAPPASQSDQVMRSWAKTAEAQGRECNRAELECVPNLTWEWEDLSGARLKSGNKNRSPKSCLFMRPGGLPWWEETIWNYDVSRIDTVFDVENLR